MALTMRLTVDDFEHLSDEEAHHKELVDGELVDVSGNNPEHNFLRGRLERLLTAWAEERGIGMVLAEQEYDFGGNAHGPDVSFFRSDKVELIEWRRRVQRFVPDLAIEIASPNDTHDNLMKKLIRYRNSGVEEVWLFSPETRRAEVLSAARNAIYFADGFFDPGPLQGLRVPLAHLFDQARKA